MCGKYAVAAEHLRYPYNALVANGAALVVIPHEVSCGVKDLYFSRDNDIPIVCPLACLSHQRSGLENAHQSLSVAYDGGDEVLRGTLRQQPLTLKTRKDGRSKYTRMSKGGGGGGGLCSHAALVLARASCGRGGSGCGCVCSAGSAAGGCLCGELAPRWSADAELPGRGDPRGCSAKMNDRRLSDVLLLQIVLRGRVLSETLKTQNPKPS